MSSRAFTRRIFVWLAQVNADPALPPSCMSIGVALAPDFNEAQGGMAWPGAQTIADRAALSKSVVIEGLRLMESRGYIRTEPGKPGRGHSTHYWMAEKGRQGDLSDAEKRSVQPEKRSAGRPDSSKTHRKKGDCYAIPPRRESRQARLDFGPGDTAGASAPPITKKRLDLYFGKLRQIWNREWPGDDAPRAVAAARAAFGRACTRAAPDAILAGAQEHRAAADGPRFLPKLVAWLDADGWAKAPPRKRTRDGPVREPRGRRKRRTAVDAMVDIVNEDAAS